MILGGKSPDLLKERIEGLTVINLKNDLYKKHDENFLNKFFKNKKLISIDCLHNHTTEESNVVLPADTFAESSGTFVNSEGRAQRFYQVYKPENKDIMQSWRIIGKLLSDSDSEENYEHILDAIASSVPELQEINTISPPPGFRVAGQKIPRAAHRFSGRTAMHANINVNEPKPPDDSDSPLTFTMEGFYGEPPSSIIPFFWSPGWNSVQSINKYQIEVGGPLHGGDPGRRLFEKKDSARLDYFKSTGQRFKERKGEYLTFPVYHIFGSEELSSEAAAVKEMIPEQCIWLNPDDAAAIDAVKDDAIVIDTGQGLLNLPVKVKLNIPQGLAGISVIAGGKRINYNQWIKVKKVNE